MLQHFKPFTCEDTGFGLTSHTEYRLWKLFAENSPDVTTECSKVKTEDPAASGAFGTGLNPNNPFESLDIEGINAEIQGDNTELESSVMDGALAGTAKPPNGQDGQPAVGNMQETNGKGTPPGQAAKTATEAVDDGKKQSIGPTGPGGKKAPESAMTTVKKDLTKAGKKIGFDVNKNAIQNMKSMAGKTSKFAKSSVKKVNDIPPKQMDKMVKEKISLAKDDPKTLSTQLKLGVKAAGKGTALAGLAIVSLPLAAAAFVANKALDVNVKKKSYEELQREIIRIDAAVDATNDPDEKADLLIAKRNAEIASVKIRYGIKNVITGTGLK